MRRVLICLIDCRGPKLLGPGRLDGPVRYPELAREFPPPPWTLTAENPLGLSEILYVLRPQFRLREFRDWLKSMKGDFGARIERRIGKRREG